MPQEMEDELSDECSDFESASQLSRPASAASDASSVSSSFVFPTSIPNSSRAFWDLETALESHEPSSDIVQNALQTLTLALPFQSPPQIVFGGGGPWGPDWKRPCIRIDHYRHSTFEDAVKNCRTPLSERAQMFLGYLLQHNSGWSATPSHHMNAPGFRYMNMLFGHMGGLYPVLDAIVWPEDARYIRGMWPDTGSHSLFVSQAGAYYVYDFLDFRLLKAGGTLEEVFNGMKAWRHQTDPEDGGWDDEDFEAENDEVDLYFPTYKPHPVDGNWILAQQIPELPLSIE